MKTLKQIREDYNAKFFDGDMPDELMFESSIESPRTKGGSLMPTKSIPSAKEMPVMLLFRRVSYRIYPNKQVVALYYSSMIDKYLSIPFGPGGNVNLSEAVILDEEQLDEILPFLAGAAEIGAGLAGSVAGTAIGGAVKKYGAKALSKGIELGKKAISSTKGKTPKPRKAPPTPKQTPKKGGGFWSSAAGGAAGSALGGSGGDGDSSGGSDSKGGVTSFGDKTYSGFHRNIGGIKTGSSFSKSRAQSDAANVSKLKQAELKSARQVHENKISDIRNMIDCGGIHEMNINGKTVTLNTSMAKRILEVYDSVNTKNKKIVEGMLNEDLESFKKLLTFSIRN